MVFVKKSIFFLYVLFKQKRKKETFFNILDRKQSFLDLKNEVLKKSKNRHFEKGLVHGFCQKIDFFFISCFLSKERQNKHFLIFWIEKNAFKTTKKKFWKTLKNRHFAKGLVHDFCQKIDVSLICFSF